MGEREVEKGNEEGVQSEIVVGVESEVECDNENEEAEADYDHQFEQAESGHVADTKSNIMNDGEVKLKRLLWRIMRVTCG